MQQKYLVDTDQLLDSAHQFVAGAFVVLDNDTDFATVDAPFGVHVVIDHLGCVQRVEPKADQRSGQRREQADDNFVIGYAGRLRVHRRQDGERGRSQKTGCKALK